MLDQRERRACEQQFCQDAAALKQKIESTAGVHGGKNTGQRKEDQRCTNFTKQSNLS